MIPRIIIPAKRTVTMAPTGSNRRGHDLAAIHRKTAASITATKGPELTLIANAVARDNATAIASTVRLISLVVRSDSSTHIHAAPASSAPDATSAFSVEIFFLLQLLAPARVSV